MIVKCSLLYYSCILLFLASCGKGKEDESEICLDGKNNEKGCLISEKEIFLDLPPYKNLEPNFHNSPKRSGYFPGYSNIRNFDFEWGYHHRVSYSEKTYKLETTEFSYYSDNILLKIENKVPVSPGFKFIQVIDFRYFHTAEPAVENVFEYISIIENDYYFIDKKFSCSKSEVCLDLFSYKDLDEIETISSCVLTLNFKFGPIVSGPIILESVLKENC